MSANFVNEEAIHFRAARLAAPLPAALTARCSRLIAVALREDPRNSRPLSDDDLAEAPDWAKRAALEGRTPTRFVAHPQAAAQIRRLVVRVLAAHIDLCNIPAEAAGLEAIQRLECSRLFDSIGQMSFADLDEKTRRLSRRRRQIILLRRVSSDRLTEHFPADFVLLEDGRRWRRLVSTGALGMCGKRMRNCTAYDRSSHGHYAGMLERNEAHFWTLETHDGAPSALVMISTASRTVAEAKLVQNVDIPWPFPELDTLLAQRDYKSIAPRVINREHQLQEDLILLRRMRSVLTHQLSETRATAERVPIALRMLRMPR